MRGGSEDKRGSLSPPARQEPWAPPPPRPNPPPMALGQSLVGGGQSLSLCLQGLSRGPLDEQGTQTHLGWRLPVSSQPPPPFNLSPLLSIPLHPRSPGGDGAMSPLYSLAWAYPHFQRIPFASNLPWGRWTPPLYSKGLTMKTVQPERDPTAVACPWRWWVSPCDEVTSVHCQQWQGWRVTGDHRPSMEPCPRRIQMPNSPFASRKGKKKDPEDSR